MSIGGSSSASAKKENVNTVSTGTKTEQLQLDQAAIDKLIQDVLGGADGLASIFGGEQSSGLYNSSTANQAAGDLTAKLVGELAKITGKTVTNMDSTDRTKTEAYDFSVSADAKIGL